MQQGEPIHSQVTSGFWRQRQEVNAHAAIFHQWERLEKSGCIDNFRILAENKPVSRKGWFFADSDAYKWLEAAAIIQKTHPSSQLDQLVDEFIDLLQRTQAPDGYLYTYNQIHFPHVRWKNLQIEHELYCHGHLIEAGVSHYLCSGKKDMLNLAIRAADCIVAFFAGKDPRYTPGHEEIEIALLRLFAITGQPAYQNLAAQFLEKRGRIAVFPFQMVREFLSNHRRMAQVDQQDQADFENRDDLEIKILSPGNKAKKPKAIKARFLYNALTGRLFQQNRPLATQKKPIGHAVRYVYLQTAAAMMDRQKGSAKYRAMLENSWVHLVKRQMYLTGGVGSLPEIEGFGRDYELDPKFAYAETCAALGCLFWNREMTSLTGAPQYSDLFEWQLYNAALVGMGLDGCSYFYNNPLQSEDKFQRQPWFEVPCCPSNLSRTIANIARDVLFTRADGLYLQQYISSCHDLIIDDLPLKLEMESQLPWRGSISITFQVEHAMEIPLRLRHPSWASSMRLQVNDEPVQTRSILESEQINPNLAEWVEVNRSWNDGDRLSIDFDMPVRLLFADQRVRSVRGMTAVKCGPLVFCLESCDNPDIDIFNVVLDSDRLQLTYAPDLFGGTNLVRAFSKKGEPLTFIPYHLWGNRGASEMTVFCRV